jgi:hypothetical protein
LKAQTEGKFDKQIVPITVEQTLSMKMVKKKPNHMLLLKMKVLELELHLKHWRV